MRLSNLRRILPLAAVLALVAAAIVYLNGVAGRNNGPLTASGTVESVTVAIGSEVSGRVVDVLVGEGERVRAGEPVIRLDDQLLKAQRDRAQAATQTAAAALNTARAALDSARIQHDLAVNAAHAAEAPARQATWRQSSPSEFDLPVWYFPKSDQVAAAEEERIQAKAALGEARANYSAEVAKLPDLIQAQSRLAQAEAAFLVAKDVLDRARQASSGQDLIDAAQARNDAARSELDGAQAAYKQVLSDTSAADVLKARALLAAAQERYDTAWDRRNSLQTGMDSLQVRAADAALHQAEAATAQAEAADAQAKAELTLIDVQLGKLVVKAPADGVVTTRSIEPGEVLTAGAAALDISRLDKLTITVYVPEDRYGQISLGEHVRVAVDAFPGVAFDASVSRIADRAEFTPRNVQTEEGRRTTVFAVELSIQNPEGKLKPGMPADVTFGS